MKDDLKKQSLLQLRKAQGLLKKVVNMIEEDKYCVDILQQSLAADGCIKSANKTILENHLNSCFKAGMKSGNKEKNDELIAEILKIFKRI